MIKTVSVQELCEQLDTDPQTVLIDLRTPREFTLGHVVKARNIPYGTMSVREIMAEWSREAEGKPIYFICQTGGHSQQLLDELEDVGFYLAQSVAGGMVAWHALGLPLDLKTHGAAGEEVFVRVAQVTAGLLILAGCALGLFVHAGFLSIPMLVAAGILFRGLTGKPALVSVFGRKGGTG